MKEPVQLKESVKERIDQLPEQALWEVSQLVDNLLDQMHTGESQGADTVAQGTVEDLLACAGTWKFDPGELEEIMRDIEQNRLMELEEDDCLLD
jgi:hypothetical protein